MICSIRPDTCFEHLKSRKKKLWTHRIVYCIYSIDNFMYITIDERDGRPLYQQLVDEIKTLIARGELAQGTSLPPVRQVASDLGVNLNTVAFAYRRLQKEGLIRVRHGSGAVVISQTLGTNQEDRLRSQLRTALTQLVLAGLKQPEIKALINEELDDLLKEARRA